jgi:hypothetical protein
VPECWEIEDRLRDLGYQYESMRAARRAIARDWGVPIDRVQPDNKAKVTSGPCQGDGWHWRAPNPNDPRHPGSIACCPCCVDEDDGHIIEWRFKVWT